MSVTHQDFKVLGLILHPVETEDGFIAEHGMICDPIVGKTMQELEHNACLTITSVVIDNGLPNDHQSQFGFYYKNPMCPAVAKRMGLQWDYETGDVKGVVSPKVMFPNA